MILKLLLNTPIILLIFIKTLKNTIQVKNWLFFIVYNWLFFIFYFLFYWIIKLIIFYDTIAYMLSNKKLNAIITELFNRDRQLTHSATRRRSDIVTTSLCTSRWRRSYVSNKTPNNVLVERHQDVLVVRLHNILLKCRDDVSRRRNNDVPSVRLLDVKTSLKWNT